MGGSEKLVSAFRSIVGRRFAARDFRSDSVDLATIRTCLSFAQRAPSSFNVQPYIAVVVTGRERKEALARAMLGENGKRVLAAPVSVVFAADMECVRLTDKVVKLAEESGAPTGFVKQLPTFIQMFSGGHENSVVRNAVAGLKCGVGEFLKFVPGAPVPTFNSPEAWVYKQTMMAAMSYMHAATAHGLDTSPMEGFVGPKVLQALQIPERYSIPLVISTGLAGSPPKIRSGRFPPQEVFFDDCFGKPLDGVPVFDFSEEVEDEVDGNVESSASA